MQLVSSFKVSYSNIYKNGYLVCLILSGVLMGIHFDMPNITQSSLCKKLNVTYDVLGRVKSFEIIPTIISLLTVGFLHDTYPFLVPYLIIGEILILSITSLAISYTTSLAGFAISLYLQLSTLECLTTGSYWNIFRLFKKQSAGKMQLYHLGFGIGVVLCGQICAPFLPSNSSISSIKLTKYCKRIQANKNDTILFNDTASNVTLTTSNFEYAYRIAAGLDLIPLVIFVLYHFFVPKPTDVQDYADKKKEPLSRSINPKYFSPNRPKFGIVVASLLMLFYFFFTLGFYTIGPNIFVYVTDPCNKYHMSPQEGATFSSAYSAAFMIGRFFNSFVVNLDPLLLLLIYNIISVVTVIVMILDSSKKRFLLWICTLLLYFVNSINYPAGTSTFNQYIIVSGSLISTVFVFAAFGAFLGQNLGSTLIDNYHGVYLVYSSLIGIGAVLMIVVVMFILGRKYEVRDFTTDKNDAN